MPEQHSKARLIPNTNKGRAVKRLLAVGAAAAFAFTMISGQVRQHRDSSNGAPDDVVAQQQLEGQRSNSEPQVAAPVSNPQTGLKAAAGQKAPSGLSDPESYQQMLTTAQRAAEAFASYSYKQTAQQWVSSIPGLDPALTAKLTESSGSSWRGIVAQKVTSTAQLAGSTPQLVSYSEGKGDARVAVSVEQSQSSTKGKSRTVRSYLVTSKRVAKKDASAKGVTEWQVTGIESN